MPRLTPILFLLTVLVLVITLPLTAGRGFAQAPADTVPEASVASDVDSIAAGEAPDPRATIAEVGAGVVGTVEVRCDDGPCEDATFANSLYALIDLPIGGRVGAAELRAATNRLLAIEFFESIQVHVETLPNSTWAVRFDCQRVDLIARTRVNAQLALGSEIRRRLFLRSGQRWTNDPAVVERQRVAIEEYFEADGFFDSTIRLYNEESVNHEVDLDVRIQRGTRRAVGTLYTRGHAHFSYQEVLEILMAEFNLSRTFTTERFERAQDALLQQYRDDGYLQARILLDDTRFNEDGTVDLFLDIREGDQWRVLFRGNRLFSSRGLAAGLLFLETGFIDEEEIQLAIRSMKSRYETIGHFFAEISASQSVAPDGVNELVFDIREGVVAEVQDIRFEGVSFFSPEALSAVVNTSEYAVVSVGGYVQRAVLDQDIASIEALYRQNGFLQAHVSRVVLVGGRDGRDLTVAFHVVEGPQTTVLSYDTQAAAELPASVGEQLLLRRDGPFSAEAWQNDLGQIAAGYRALGYPGAEVSGVCTTETGVEVPCSPPEWPLECRYEIAADRDIACERTSRGGMVTEECVLLRADPSCQLSSGIQGEHVGVRVSVNPRGQAVFGQAFIQGNFLTRSRVLRRELPFRPGQPFNYETLLLGQSNIRALRLYDSVRAQVIYTRPEGEPNNVAHVLIQLEETRYHSLDHRVGLETRVTPSSDLLVIFSNEPTWRHANVAGSGVELRALGNFDLDILEPQRINEGDYRAGFSLIYLDPRVWFGNLLSDAWEMRMEVNLIRDQLAVAPAPQRRTIEGLIRLREEFESIRGLFVEAAVSFRRTAALDQSDPVVVSTTFDPALILSLLPRITLERRDNPLNPTRGGFLQLQIEVADDFAGVLNSARFTKITQRASYYFPLAAGFVLGANVRLGFGFGGISQGFRSSESFALPLSERYALGGVTSLRGFAEGQISSVATDEFGGDIVLNSNVELRYPFLRDWGVYGAAFVDAGQLARNLNDIRLDETRVAAGLGLRILVAELLPIVVDYGAVLGRRPGERFGRLHFNIGYTF
jgi:outer membrane protein assembly factor BamA